jgi:hypothetical protein
MLLKTFAMFVVAGGLMIAGENSARAATGGCEMSPAPATARAPATEAPATAGRAGTQAIRRYSAAPGTYRAPAMRSYRSGASSGPSYSATRKILGY